MNVNDAKIRTLFAQAYILGGSPCSGKSTIAERLAAQYALPYYKVDDHEREHAARLQPDRHPIMFAYAQRSWNEIWMRPVAQQVQEEFAYYRERFELILQDLEEYAVEQPLLLEGAAYLPELLEPYRVNPARVIYMVPTKAFQVQHYQQRPWIHQILQECDDPREAFERWMMRDHLFGQEILRQANAHGYQTLIVDGQQRIDEQYERVKSSLGFSSS